VVDGGFVEMEQLAQRRRGLGTHLLVASQFLLAGLMVKAKNLAPAESQAFAAPATDRLHPY
jgi:hypothetical protein